MKWISCCEECKLAKLMGLQDQRTRTLQDSSSELKWLKMGKHFFFPLGLLDTSQKDDVTKPGSELSAAVSFPQWRWNVRDTNCKSHLVESSAETKSKETEREEEGDV